MTNFSHSTGLCRRPVPERGLERELSLWRLARSSFRCRYGQIHDRNILGGGRVSSGAGPQRYFRRIGRESPTRRPPSQANSIGSRSTLPRTRSTFTWHNTTRVRDVEKEVAELKQRYAPEVQFMAAPASPRHGSRRLRGWIQALDLSGDAGNPESGSSAMVQSRARSSW